MKTQFTVTNIRRGRRLLNAGFHRLLLIDGKKETDVENIKSANPLQTAFTAALRPTIAVRKPPTLTDGRPWPCRVVARRIAPLAIRKAYLADGMKLASN